MPQPLLIIISGPPCTGKTFLAKKIANQLRLPVITKDGIKESLFNDLGWSDRAWSRKLGMASFTLLYYFLESSLAAGVSCIIESNFKPAFDNQRFVALKEKYEFEPFQIMCKTDGEVLFERFKKRSESGERHPGHVDHLNYDEVKTELLKGSYEPLSIGGNVYEVDTTDFAVVDYEAVFSRLQQKLN